MNHYQPDGDADGMPPQLATNLKDLFTTSAPPAREAEDAILAAARVRLTELGSKPTRSMPRRWLPLAAAAAALLAWASLNSEQVAGDLDGDGQVNVLDAFQLARALRDGDSHSAVDGTGDGQVDRADVLRLMQQAVEL